MNYSDSKNHEMPAGFGYLMAFAYSIQVNDDWFAASGVSRGDRGVKRVRLVPSGMFATM